MKALVTGANGHLGTALTELLVQSGHTVRASMRGSADPVKSGPLRKLGVEVVEADVMDAAALERACEGIEVVFHLAAVFRFIVADAQKDLIDPAVKGAENALRAAKKHGVRRVVLTSSNVAVGTHHLDRPLDERDWNDSAVNPYAIAKTQAERRAWEVSKELGVDLVCINPVAIIGPGFARHTPITLVFKAMISGEMPMAPKFAATYVDNRDVAKAHLLAAETPAANGRYLVSSGETILMLELAQRIKRAMPDAKVPGKELPGFMMPVARAIDWTMNKTRGLPRQLSGDMIEDFSDIEVRFSAERAKRELKWQPRALDESIKDTAEWIVKAQPAMF